MSKEKRMVEISASGVMPGRNMEENVVSRGHKCGYCQGNGYFWLEDEHREPYKSPCPVCGGSGLLDAVITVRWKASEK